MLCPICDRDNPATAVRCRSCGADFEDPELAAQLVRAPVDDDELILTGDRYLGVRWAGLVDGHHTARVGLIGGLVFLVAALLPVNLDFTGIRASWSALGDGPTLALLLPALCAGLGLGLAFAGPRLPPAVAAGVLAAGGAAVLTLGVAPLGTSCALPDRVPYLVWLGLTACATGVAVRVLRPRDPHVRWLVVAGAVIFLIGMFLPHTDARHLVPGEYVLYMRDSALIDKSLAGVSLDGFDHDVMVRFLSIWHLLIIGLCAVAAGLAVPASTGPWDKLGLALRPVGWVLVFFIPASMVFYTLNVVGWREVDEKVVDALFAGRARLAVVTLPATAWLVTGLTGLYATLVAPRLPAAPTTGEPARSG